MVACSCKFSIEVDKTSQNPLSCSRHFKNVPNIYSHVIGGLAPAFHSAKLTQDVEGRGLNPI